MENISLKKISIISDEIYADTFYIDDSIELSKKPIAIYFGGLPTTGGKNMATYFFAKQGYLVVQPQYLGTFDSGNVFSPENLRVSIEKTINILERKNIFDIKKETDVPISGDIRIAMGHSFGCNALLYAIDILKNKIDLLLFFSPVIGFGANYGSLADPKKQIDYIIRARPYTYRLSYKDWMRYFDKDLNGINSPVERLKRLSFCKTLIIYGQCDSNFNIEKVTSLIKESDNPFISLYIANGAKHGIESLLTDVTKNKIKNELKALFEK